MSRGERTPWIQLRVEQTPHATALQTQGGPLSFGELAGRARRAAGLLRSFGAPPGAVVATLLSNGPAFAEWLHGIDLAGATLLPLNVRLTIPELAFQLRDSGAGFLVYETRLEERARQASAALETHLVCSDAHRDADPLKAPVHGRSEPLVLLYTSGTTGRPKAAELGSENFWHGAVASALHMGVLPSDCWVACLPLYHVGGLAILLRCCLYGLPVVLHEGFDPSALSRAVDREGVTLVSLVPTMLARWLDERDGRPLPPHLRAVLVGGARAPEALLERAARLGVPALPSYGLTETASQVATRIPGDGAQPRGGRLRPLLGTRLRIAREDGSVAAPGEPGEIWIRGPSVMRGYRNRPAANERALRGGWLRSGDLGTVDEAGLLQVLDRRDDLIVSGGENVYPAEVEAVLAGHPAVREVAVGARPDRDYGERPVAWIVAREPELTSEALRSFCRERLAGYKLPVCFEFVDSLPRNALGKVRRHALRSPSP